MWAPVRLRDLEYVRTAPGRDLIAPGLPRGQQAHLAIASHAPERPEGHHRARTTGQVGARRRTAKP
jgi:hypothetical protein